MKRTRESRSKSGEIIDEEETIQKHLGCFDTKRSCEKGLIRSS